MNKIKWNKIDYLILVKTLFSDFLASSAHRSSVVMTMEYDDSSAAEAVMVPWTYVRGERRVG